MKTILFTFLLTLISSILFSQSQITNGDLETWSDIYNADGWNSVNITFPFTVHSAEQTSDAAEGSFAAELTSSSTVLGLVPGLLTLGEIDIENFTVTGGAPFSDRPTGASFQFKYNPAQSDTMFFIGLLTKWNETNEETDTIGITAYFTNVIYSDYTNVAVPFIYESEEIPDTLNLVFLSSGFTGNEGSSLLIDNVLLEYGTIISPTLCFPAEDITSSNFTANWLTVPDAVSYNIDVSTEDDFSSFYNSLEDMSAGSDTFYTVEIVPGLYYYRTRVFYDPEVSLNSNTIAVPSPTNCLEATDVAASAFTANWESATNATNYYIDVSENANFDNYVGAYENFFSRESNICKHHRFKRRNSLLSSSEN